MQFTIAFWQVTDPSRPLLLCPSQVTWAAFPLYWRRQMGTAQSCKHVHLVAAFLQMKSSIWWWGSSMGTGCLVEQESSQSPGPGLVGRTVQAIEDSVWAYISLRLQRTWSKIKSSVQETHHVQKKRTSGEQVKDLTPPSGSKDDSRNTVL